ncbi:DUF6356 family protein [Roseovarius salis]|uniref:DUF6356 family protein n=1 Tax=Roseovarius salis TaxID=3376063 RepID=UPI0037CB5632
MIRKIFLDHPRSVDETYLEHAAFAGMFGARLLAAGCCALVHAIVPAAFETTASRMIADMHARTRDRG